MSNYKYFHFFSIKMEKSNHNLTPCHHIPLVSKLHTLMVHDCSFSSTPELGWKMIFCCKSSSGYGTPFGYHTRLQTFTKEKDSMRSVGPNCSFSVCWHECGEGKPILNPCKASPYDDNETGLPLEVKILSCSGS